MLAFCLPEKLDIFLDFQMRPVTIGGPWYLLPDVVCELM